MLKPFARNIWTADGPEVAVAGFRFPTRMAVMRLADHSLVVWSPVALTDTMCDELDALGPVLHIVAPNSLHHLFLDEWQRLCPLARTYAPPGLRARRKDLLFDRDLDGTAYWPDEIDYVLVQGNRITTEAVFFHRSSGTVLFTDLLQQIPPEFVSGWRALVAKLDRMTGPEPQVPNKFRLAFTNRRAARAGLSCILEWPAERVLIAHGPPVEHDAQHFLRRAFRWL